jgi:hypothetical protein
MWVVGGVAFEPSGFIVTDWSQFVLMDIFFVHAINGVIGRGPGALDTQRAGEWIQAATAVP